MTKPISMNPSSFNEVYGVTTNTQYPSGCFRFLSVRHLLRDKIPKSDIHPIYQSIGTIGEERIFTLFPDYVREVPFEHEMVPGVVIRGRADGVSKSKILEVKNTISQSVRTNVVRKGNLPSTYLGQLLTYMWVFDKKEGLISVSYVHFNKLATELQFEERRFEITIDENGAVLVDGIKTIDSMNWYVTQFYTLLAHYITSNELAPMPITNRPCESCVLSDVCKSNIKSKHEFTEKIDMIEVGEEQEMKFVPRIKNHNTKL